MQSLKISTAIHFVFHHLKYYMQQTHECNQLEEVFNHVDGRSLVLFDLDNTLIESNTHLGSLQWSEHLAARLINNGHSFEEADRITDHFWIFVQPFIPMRLVDPQAVNVLSRLKKQGIPVLALTARDPLQKEETIKSLFALNLDFKTPHESQMLIAPPTNALFHEGVIFSGKNDKSASLFAFLKKNNISFDRIVFIDDKWEHVLEMEEALKKKGIAYRGLRFGLADARVSEFNPALAELQWLSLPHLLSDEEARVKWEKNGRVGLF